MKQQYPVQKPEEIPSPSLLVNLARVETNIQHAITVVDDEPSRLRPHVKTHKCLEIVRLELEAGITKHKCATLREAEMLAEAGVMDIVIAYPVLGPNLETFVRLKRHFPQVDFKPVVDSAFGIQQISDTMVRHGLECRVLLDLDLGGHRTGIPISDEAAQLYQLIGSSPGLEPYGLHAYDGPTTETDTEKREALCLGLYEQTCGFRDRLRGDGFEVPIVIMGGTPSFPVYAKLTDVEASPGTFVLHDHNYTTRFPSLGFSPAALILSRVISAATPGLATLDLGYKAISPDSQVRGAVWGREDIEMGPQTEEHWVLHLPDGQQATVGDVMLVCPGHICPTVAMHERLVVLNEDGEWIDTWQVAARGRQLNLDASR